MQPWKIVSSTFHVGAETEGWNLTHPASADDEAGRIFRFTVYFDAPFAAPPVVHLSLTGFDLDQRDSNRLRVRAAEISAEGFVAELLTWRDTRVYSADVSWLAIGA